MADTVLIASRKDGRTVRVDRRLADYLVTRGTFEYLTQAVEPEGKSPRAPRKRTSYRRRDMRAE